METEAVGQAAIHSHIGDIDPCAWDRCAGDDNPFICHAFLQALEESGSATAETGWLGQHILLADNTGGPLAAMPLYLKSHSFGEYVFDHGWADAYERAGGQYYPKLQCSVPFTPATGPRLLVPAVGERAELRRALASAAVALAGRHQVSSLHITFAEQDEAAALAKMGLAIRTDQQFHWQNQGYATFADFLDALTSRKRKTIRRERRDAIAAGIEIDTLSGSNITEDHWDHFFQFYMETGGRKWGRPYLTRAFFSMIGEAMSARIVLIMAKRDGRYIAGALNLVGRDIIYGRHWGCAEHHPFLHFELCYYRAIDYAIEHGLARVEAGAQGEHKLARGYVPTKTYSAHWIADPGFRRAIDDYLEMEKRDIDRAIEILSSYAPFKSGAS